MQSDALEHFGDAAGAIFDIGNAAFQGLEFLHLNFAFQFFDTELAGWKLAVFEVVFDTKADILHSKLLGGVCIYTTAPDFGQLGQLFYFSNVIASSRISP